jgi:hypothetical protein
MAVFRHVRDRLRGKALGYLESDASRLEAHFDITLDV